MTFVLAGHIILTPTQPVGSGRPQQESNPGVVHSTDWATPPPARDVWSHNNYLKKEQFLVSLSWTTTTSVDLPLLFPSEFHLQLPPPPRSLLYLTRDFPVTLTRIWKKIKRKEKAWVSSVHHRTAWFVRGKKGFYKFHIYIEKSSIKFQHKQRKISTDPGNSRLQSM